MSRSWLVTSEADVITATGLSRTGWNAVASSAHRVLPERRLCAGSRGRHKGPGLAKARPASRRLHTWQLPKGQGGAAVRTLGSGACPPWDPGPTAPSPCDLEQAPRPFCTPCPLTSKARTTSGVAQARLRLAGGRKLPARAAPGAERAMNEGRAVPVLWTVLPPSQGPARRKGRQQGLLPGGRGGPYITQDKWTRSEKYRAKRGRWWESSGPACPSTLLPLPPQGVGGGGLRQSPLPLVISLADGWRGRYHLGSTRAASSCGRS